MSIQYSDAVRNAAADSFETTIGASPILRIRNGTKPANCAAARAGTVLVTINLPSDWLTAASGGSKSKNGTWQDTSADATGTPTHYEIMDSTGTTCHEQGDVSLTGGGGDLTLDSMSITAGQQVTITGYTKNVGGG